MDTQEKLEMWRSEKEKIDKERAERPQYSRLEDGDILDISKVSSILEKTYEFEDEKGNPKTVMRKIYIMEDGTRILVPVSLHEKITDIVDEWGTQIKIKVVKKGQGRKTRYDAMPIPLSKD